MTSTSFIYLYHCITKLVFLHMRNTIHQSSFVSKIKHVESCLRIMIDSVGLHKCCANRSMETHCGHRVPKKIPGLEALCFTN